MAGDGAIGVCICSASIHLKNIYWKNNKEGTRTRMVVPNPEGFPSPPLHEKEVAASGERYQTPDWVIDGWPEAVTPLAEEIHSDFNKEHGTNYKFQLKK